MLTFTKNIVNLANLIELNVVSEFCISFSHLGDSARFFWLKCFWTNVWNNKNVLW